MDCYYHPSNPLLNFCNTPTCALPLCSKCIHIHLSQSDSPHQVLDLKEALAIATEKLQTASADLNKEIRELREELNPIRMLNDYKQVLTKYRNQAIDEVKRHYDNIQNDFLIRLKSSYAQHLQPIITPIQQQLAIIEIARDNIAIQEKSMQTLILVVAEQRIQAASQLITEVENRKLRYIDELPRLQSREDPMWNIQTPTPVYSVSYVPTVPPLISSPASYNYQAAIGGINRIAQLEARLHALRYAG